MRSTRAVANLLGFAAFYDRNCKRISCFRAVTFAFMPNAGSEARIRWNRIGFIVHLIALASAITLVVGVGRPTADVERSWTVGGVERKALVYAPASASTTLSAIIFAFHGHGGTATFASNKYDYQHVWPDAIVVYMQGLPTVGGIIDPNGTKPGWQFKAGDEQDRDLNFFDVVLASLSMRIPLKAISIPQECDRCSTRKRYSFY